MAVSIETAKPGGASALRIVHSNGGEDLILLSAVVAVRWRQAVYSEHKYAVHVHTLYDLGQGGEGCCVAVGSKEHCEAVYRKVVAGLGWAVIE